MSFLNNVFITVWSCLLDVYSGVSYSGPKSHRDSVTRGCKTCNSSVLLSLESFLIASIIDRRLSISLKTVKASFTDHLFSIVLRPVISSSESWESFIKSSFPFFDDSKFNTASTAIYTVSLVAVGEFIEMFSIISSTSYWANGEASFNLAANSCFTAAFVSSKLTFAVCSNIVFTYSATVRYKFSVSFVFLKPLQSSLTNSANSLLCITIVYLLARAVRPSK